MLTVQCRLVGRISCERLSPTSDCFLADLSQTQLLTTSKKDVFLQLFLQYSFKVWTSSSSNMLPVCDPSVISRSVDTWVVLCQISRAQKHPKQWYWGLKTKSIWLVCHLNRSVCWLKSPLACLHACSTEVQTRYMVYGHRCSTIYIPACWRACLQ